MYSVSKHASCLPIWFLLCRTALTGLFSDMSDTLQLGLRRVHEETLFILNAFKITAAVLIVLTLDPANPPAMHSLSFLHAHVWRGNHQFSRVFVLLFGMSHGFGCSVSTWLPAARIQAVLRMARST